MTKTINLPTQEINSRKRLVFTWRNNSTGGEQPPVAIDNISFSNDGPYYTISDRVWSFGEIDLETTSQIQTFTITNTGYAPLVIDSISLAGIHTADFAINTSNLPCDVSPDDIYTFAVSFTPITSPGMKKASILIYHNAPFYPSIVTLSGRGLGNASLPYRQEFTDLAFPPTAPDWDVIDKDGDSHNWYLHEGSARSDANQHNQNNRPDNWLITPRFAFEADATYAIKWDSKVVTLNYYDDFISVYIMSGINPLIDCIDDAPGNTVIFSGITQNTWQSYSYFFTPDDTIEKYIGFRHHRCFATPNLQIDNVHIYKLPDYDIEVMQLTGSYIYSVQSPYTVTLRNGGVLDIPAGAYDIAFMYEDAQGNIRSLGQPITNTPALVALETTQVVISDTSSWDFEATDTTTFNLYAKVISP